MDENKTPTPNKDAHLAATSGLHRINWEPVSTQVKETVYNAITDTLTITFKTGAKYEYYHFLAADYERLKQTASIGKFINSDIKGKFTYKKL